MRREPTHPLIKDDGTTTLCSRAHYNNVWIFVKLNSAFGIRWIEPVSLTGELLRRYGNRPYKEKPRDVPGLLCVFKRLYFTITIFLVIFALGSC